jgi:hypothetical protein
MLRILAGLTKIGAKANAARLPEEGRRLAALRSLARDL